MVALLRYLLITSTLVGIAWACFAVRVGDRTVFGHLRAMTDTHAGSLIARIRDEIDEQTKSTKAKPPAAKAKPKSRPADRRVARLDAASKAVKGRKRHRRAKPAATKRKTRIDERISPKEETALDELLDARIARLQ